MRSAWERAMVPGVDGLSADIEKVIGVDWVGIKGWISLLAFV